MADRSAPRMVRMEHPEAGVSEFPEEYVPHALRRQWVPVEDPAPEPAAPVDETAPKRSRKPEALAPSEAPPAADSGATTEEG